MAIEEEIRTCFKKLKVLLSDIEELRELIADKQQLLGAEKKSAQEKLKILKKKLDDEYRRISTQRSKTSLNETEKKYYTPAVRQASANLGIRTNSAPGSMWQAELGELASKFKFHIDQLRQQRET